MSCLHFTKIIAFFIFPFFAWMHNFIQAEESATKFHHVQEKPIVVIIPSYNTEKWCHSTLKSTFAQKYNNYRVIFIDDSSQDLTLDQALSFLYSRKIPCTVIHFDDAGLSIEEASDLFAKQVANNQDQKCLVIHNKNRCGALENIYRAIYSCANEKAIIVLLDGDDQLYGKFVFKDVNAIYSLTNVWLTHGSCTSNYSELPRASFPIPRKYIKKNTFRKFWLPSHLQTFYVALFKKIQLEDLLMPESFFDAYATLPMNIQAKEYSTKRMFLPVAWDVGIMYPMIEMAGKHHYFFSKINYIYNNANDLNDHKLYPQLQLQLANYLRKKHPYKKLSSLFS